MAQTYKAIDLQSGKEIYINFEKTNFIFSKDISKNVIKIECDNKRHYYKMIENIDKPLRDLSLSGFEWDYAQDLDIIKVHFNPWDKGYSYFVDKELKAQIEEVISRRTISIKTPYGDKNILEIDKDYHLTETDWQNATKLLKLSDKEVEKRIIVKYWNRQKGELDRPIYQYLIDKEENIKERAFYTILPNNELIYIQQISNILKKKSSIFLRKKLINPQERIENLSQEERKIFFDYCSCRNIELPLNIIVPTTQQNFEQENKGENNMNTNKIFKNLEFGKINTDAIKMSVNGLAFKQEDGTYVTYDALKNEFTDVTPFILDFNLLCAMPVAIGDIAENDIIKHNGKYVIVKEILEDNTISAINPIAGEEIIIIPTKNIFGFNYYTKIMNVFAGFDMDAKPNEDNPFGNMLPFLFMNENKGDMSDFLLMSMMTNQKEMMTNPMLMFAFMNKN
jgi:hypothetical protein